MSTQETMINLKLRKKENALHKERGEIWGLLINPLTAEKFRPLMFKKYAEAYQILIDMASPSKWVKVRELTFQHYALSRELERLSRLIESHQKISPTMRKFFAE